MNSQTTATGKTICDASNTGFGAKPAVPTTQPAANEHRPANYQMSAVIAPGKGQRVTFCPLSRCQLASLCMVWAYDAAKRRMTG